MYHGIMIRRLHRMKGEYELIKGEREKDNSKKFQAKMLMAFVSGLEFLNTSKLCFSLSLTELYL